MLNIIRIRIRSKKQYSLTSAVGNKWPFFSYTSYHLDSEHAHLLGCFPRPSGKASGQVSLDEAWRAAGARDVREP